MREEERNEDKWLHRRRARQIMKRANKRETKRWMERDRERNGGGGVSVVTRGQWDQLRCYISIIQTLLTSGLEK